MNLDNILNEKIVIVKCCTCDIKIDKGSAANAGWRIKGEYYFCFDCRQRGCGGPNRSITSNGLYLNYAENLEYQKYLADEKEKERARICNFNKIY